MFSGKEESYILGAFVVFKDKFPLQLEFDIDRERLTRYYRFQSFIGCVAIAIPVGVIAAFGFLKPFLQVNNDFTLIQRVVSSVCFIVGGMFAGLFVGMALYYPCFHKSSQRAARNLRLIVEGPYLRLVSGSYFVVDRRYHFNEIHTYTTFQGPLQRRFGMKTLMINVAVRQIPPVHVDGLIDTDSVRDKLCEMDAVRESSWRSTDQS